MVSLKMNHQLLFELLTIPSPSGHEGKIKKFIAAYLSEREIQTTDLGPAGLSWEIGKGEKQAFFSAHIDQVSCIVERIDDEGYIYIEMPGIDPRILPSQEVTVLGKKELKGVVGMPPPHFASVEERRVPIPRERLYVDVGLSAEDARELIPVGSPCTWQQAPAELLGSRVTGVGLDNRVGVFLELLLTEELLSQSLPGRIRFFASTQEEGAMLGAGFAGRSAFLAGEVISFAVVVDATFGTGPGEKDLTFPLSKGPILGVGPILSRPHLAVMRALASRLSITYALEPLVRSTGTEADVLSVAGEGIPLILLSIPLRYMHSPVEVVDLDDVDASLQLLTAVFGTQELWNC